MLKTIALIIVSFSSQALFAQVESDTAFVMTAQQNALQLYENALRAQSRLNNGSRYVAPEYNTEQHPWFASDDWVIGSVFYDGKYFKNVPLMYDMFGGVIVTEHFPSGHPIQLVNEKLQHFTLADHHFERITRESVANSLPATGFYDVLYPGETKVIVRRQKQLNKSIVSTRVETSFEERNRYFLMRNGVFFPVKSKGSVLKLMSDRKGELKQLLKQKRMRYADDRELALATLAAHYDTIK